MTAASDTLLVTGPVNQQVSADSILVTPTGGTQGSLASHLATATGGAVSATTLTASGAVTLSPASAAVAISPTGTGTVAISPVGALTVAPTAASTIDNVAIGGTTALVGTFTYARQSVGNALSAAGTTRADATALTKAVNNVTTAAASTGVILPSLATAGIGSAVVVFNAGANAMKVYGAGSDTIDGTAGSTGVTLTNAKRCLYYAVAANTWISAQLGVVSA